MLGATTCGSIRPHPVPSGDCPPTPAGRYFACALGRPGRALRLLKVSAAPKRVDDLLRFLRQIGYVADEIDHGVVHVEQASDRAPAGTFVLALALSLQLRVWNVVNDAEARIIEVSGSLEP